MGINHRFSDSRLYQSISIYLSKLQEGGRPSKSTVEAIWIARGLILLFFALGLAWLSIKSTEKMSIRHYRENFWPSNLIRRSILLPHGLEQKDNLFPYQKLIESIPGSLLVENAVLVDQDTCIAYFPSSPEHRRVELWSCVHPPKTTNWIHLGKGMEGLEHLIEILEKKPLKPDLPPTQRAKLIDPKEFHY